MLMDHPFETVTETADPEAGEIRDREFAEL
jgi:hypothetical protein